MGGFCRGGRGERCSVSSTLCRYDVRMGLIGSKLGEGATCFSGKGEFGRGDLRDVLMYEFVMVVGDVSVLCWCVFVLSLLRSVVV